MPTDVTSTDPIQRPTIERIPFPEGALPDGGSVGVGVSYIGGVQNDKAWYHVSLREEFEGFEAVSIEVVDAVTGQILAGPLALSERDSELCHVRLYETEGIDVSELPQDWWYQQTIEPYYIYRIKLRDQFDRDQIVEVYDIPGVCESAAV